MNVCDYYAEVGVRERLTHAATNRCPPGASVERLLLGSVFEPAVLLRHPQTDREVMKFAPEVAMFSFPHGVRLVSPEEAALNAIPVVTSFVLTTADKSRMYGACIVWYEELPSSVASHFLLEMEADEAEVAAPPTVHAPEAICLLSRAPIFEPLMECCRQLFRMRLQITDGGGLSEECLAPLLSTPLPPMGGSCSLQLGNVSVPVAVPSEKELPHTMSGRDFLLLLQSLDVSSLIILWALVLAENKIVLQARQPHVLTMAAETLCALLFPFSWQHVYIPILPARLLDVLQAPVPFIIGIDEEVLSMAEAQHIIPDDVVQVDLDNSTISCQPSIASQIQLPQKQYHKLYKALAPFCRRVTDTDAQSNAASAFRMAPPPDVEGDEHGAKSLAEMSDEEVAAAITTVKSACLRFFVSIMAKYQDLMVVPSAEIKMPAALDFFDVKKWMGRFSHHCAPWLEMFSNSQSFTEWLEARLAPSDEPKLEVMYFNEAIDAKLARGTKTKFFTRTREVVPAQVRTVYNASMIAARPQKAQQKVAMLLVMASGMQQHETAEVQAFEETLKQEFARNLCWSRVDLNAALMIYVSPWRSGGSEFHTSLSSALENLPVRKALLDLTLYSRPEVKSQLDASMRGCLATIARVGGGNLPLCVVAHGFGSVLAIDFFTRLQALTAAASDGAGASLAATPLERGETLASLCTLGSPLPLIAPMVGGVRSAAVSPTHSEALVVPAPYMRERWPGLRGGWTNYYHKGDSIGFPLSSCHHTVASEVVGTARPKRVHSDAKRQGPVKESPIQHLYLTDVETFVRPIAQALSWVWQDTNRAPTKPAS